MTERVPRVMAAAVLSTIGACVAATPAPAAAHEYRLVDASQCRQPAALPRSRFKESYETYNLRRRTLDLDGSGRCVLMEYWVERIDGSPARGMRTVQQRFLRHANGKWRPFVAGLNYFPYVLKSSATGQVFLVTAPHEHDIDDMLFEGRFEVYLRKGWRAPMAGYHDELQLEPVSEQRAAILRALATQLAVRLATATGDTQVERERIERLLRQAQQAE